MVSIRLKISRRSCLLRHNMSISQKLILEVSPLAFGDKGDLGSGIVHIYSIWRLVSFPRLGCGVLVHVSIGIAIFVIVCSLKEVQDTISLSSVVISVRQVDLRRIQNILISATPFSLNPADMQLFMRKQLLYLLGWVLLVISWTMMFLSHMKLQLRNIR